MRAPDPGFARWAAGLAAAASAALLACSSAAPRSLPASAAAPPAPAGVVLTSYRAPLGCPDEQAYVLSVERRSQTLRLSASGEEADAADRLRVRIQPDTGSAGWRGQLQIEGAHPLEREVRGERCEDVALALALITVLRLDANARSIGSAPAASTAPTGATGSGGAAVPPSAAAPANSAAAAEQGTRRPPGSRAPSAPETEPADGVLLPDSAVRIVRSRGPRRAAPGGELHDDDEPSAVGGLRDTADAAERGSGTGGAEWQPSIAAHLGYLSAPSGALQARLRAELQLGPRLQSGSVALGFGYAGASDQNASADLDFALLSAQLDVCPLALGAAPWLRACAALSGGAFAVSAQALDDDLVSQSSTRAWAALGPSLEAGVPLGSSWTLRLLAETSFLLVRDSFEVERIVGDEAGQPSQITRTLLYRPPFGSFAASLGLGYAF